MFANSLRTEPGFADEDGERNHWIIREGVHDYAVKRRKEGQISASQRMLVKRFFHQGLLKAASGFRGIAGPEGDGETPIDFPANGGDIVEFEELLNIVSGPFSFERGDDFDPSKH